MRKTDKKTRRGAALIIAIAIMTVLLAIGLTFFTVARVESTTAMNVVNTVRAEHLVDAGFAMAQYRLNRDLQDHPQATSLDHAWRTMFNGAAFAGKDWANSTGDRAFNLEPLEKALRANLSAEFSNSLLYVKYRDGYTEPLFRGQRTAPWLSIPRWQGTDILLYASEADVPLCNNAGVVVADADVNAALMLNARIVRFDNYSLNADGTRAIANNELQYPFVTSSFFDTVVRFDNAGNILGRPFGLTPRWAPEQVDSWADVDTNGDGMRDSTWVPLPKDIDLSSDGIDNDLDGFFDPERTPDENSQVTIDEDGNPRRDFETGAFVYLADNATGRIVRSTADLAGPTHLALTIPLPGLRLPVDMNNDGRVDTKDYYKAGVPDPGGSPVCVILPSEVKVSTVNSPVPVPLDISAVDTLDNDYDQFVNGYNAYVFLGDPGSTGRKPVDITADATAVKNALVAAGLPNVAPPDSTAARTKYANKVIKWPTVMPVPWRPGDKTITLSPNAPQWLKDAALPPVVISLTGEPVCDVIGRAAIHVTDESAKVNMNAAGGHIYRDDIDIKAYPTTAGQHIQRALNQGASTFEYETRALPGTGVVAAADFWSMLTGAGYMYEATGAKWDYSPLPIYPADVIKSTITHPALEPYAYDISLPGYGRVDDNMNSLLIAFNGRADAGTLHPDQGLWVPPLSLPAQSVLGGTDPATLPVALRNRVGNELGGGYLSGSMYPEVAKAVDIPEPATFSQYFKLLGLMEGIDEPAELQPMAPLRNPLAEFDAEPNPGNEFQGDTGFSGDNNNDGVANEIGEAGDRVLASSYELRKAIDDRKATHYGETTWPDVQNAVTANSDSRSVNYVDSATGPRAVNKIDPNLAPPAQLAAGLLMKGDITPVTAHPWRLGSNDYKITLPTPSLTINPDPNNPDYTPLYFAEGLRQADTTVTGFIFDQPLTNSTQVPSGVNVPFNGLFAADPQLSALQTAVNIADSRDADPARSLLVMDKEINASYRGAMESLYDVPSGAPLTPPAEALNERERVPLGDIFPVGDLQDFLENALGVTPAAKRLVAVDRWWQNLTNAADGNPVNQADREDRTISYAAAGTEAIRINEMMVRPVRRVEAEAVTHLHYNTTTNNIDPAAPRSTLAFVAANGGSLIAADYANLNPTPYPGMPGFDLEAIPPVFDTGTSAWNVQSYYEPTTIPATPNRVILGDETAYSYTAPVAPGWVPEGAPLELTNNINSDIVEFRVKATDGLPGGRYYLTVNDVDPATGTMTIDNTDQLEYSVKYTNSTAAYIATGQTPSITGDVRFIENIPLDNTAADYASQVLQKNQLRADYFASYWQTVDEPEFIATDGRRSKGSGAPEGWVFAPARNAGTPLNVDNYLNLVPLVGAGVLQGLFNIPVLPVAPYTPLPPPYPADAPYRWSQAYFRDSALSFDTNIALYGADQPAGTRTLTVIVPPNNPAATYDTLCIAFRLKPAQQNILGPDGNPRKLAINFLDFSQQPDHEYVELANTTDKAINLEGWTLEVGIPDPDGMEDDPGMRDPFKSRWNVPAGTVIAPKGYLLLGFDKFDKFQTGGATDLIQANGMGLAALLPNPVEVPPLPTNSLPQAYVTVPPMAGTTTPSSPVDYGDLKDETASVFRRTAPLSTAAAGTVNTDSTDYIDNDGDGVSSAPYVYGFGSAGTAVIPNPDNDTDGVTVEAKYHGLADGTVPPFARIVQLESRGLWWEPGASETGPYAGDAKPVAAVDSIIRIAELVLRGGFLPDYPEHDGHDNDGDGGFAISDNIFTGPPALMRYVRGTLDKDMVDNNLDGRIDENGKEHMVPDLVVPGNYIVEGGTPLRSEGVDEGRLVVPFAQLVDGYRPRAYGFGSFEEGDLARIYTPFIGNDDLAKGPVVGYRYWVGELSRMNLHTHATPLAPEQGFPYSNTYPEFAGAGLQGTGNAANWQFWMLSPPATPFLPVDPVVRSEMLPGQSTSPEWKAFSERRWNPGDSVVVTLYVGPSAERKVADRATYRELDVINRAVDDIQPSPYAVDGYRNFVYDSTASPPVQWNGTNGDPVGAMVCLDRNRPQYWLPNQMGLDFYRSLERKHPLYAGDKFGTANRWEATDGSYDDWADSLSVYEADDERSGATLSEWRTNIPAPLRAIVPGAVRLFSHAMSGSPLRMNTQQRIWDNPPDLAALLAPANLGLENLELTTIPLDGPEKKLRQFVENDAVVTAYGRTENRAYSLRRAEVRNRPFNSPGDLLKLPMIGFEVPLNTGMVDNGGDYVWRSTNAAINTRWKPAGPGPGVLAYWRQDTTLKQSVLATSPDTRALGAGFAALAELSDFNTITLSVGQARFRPILSDPALALSDTYAANYLHWKEIGTFPNVAMRAPHGWTPVLLLAGYPDDPALQPSWSSLPRHTLHYPPPLPVGRVTATAPVWDPPAQWYQWNNSNKIYSVDAPYLVQTEFLRDRNRSIPVFGALSTNDVEFRWPRERLDPPTGGTLVPLEAVEYPRAAMFVSQHDENLTEEDRAEGVFSWDANDGLENGTYVAYVATFVPRMGQSLLEANERAIQGSAVTGGEFENALMPQQNPPPSLPSGSAPVLGGTEPIAAKLCALDPATPHNEGDDRFDPVLALEFVTDPAVADRVRPPGYTPLAGGRPLAALPHPKDWYPTTTPVGGQAVSTATAYRADGDGMILYSGSGQVTWRARLVRVTDRFLALRVRNLGRPDQVACISGVVLAPARHTPGKINVNTVENTKTITGDATPAAPYTFGVFNPLLGLPGVVDVLANTRNPDPLVGGLLGFPVLADTDVGWPGFSVAKASVPDPKLETWPIPMALTGLQMPPGARTADTNDPNLLAPKNTGGAWNAVSDGAAALRLSSMMMTGRPGHFDGRYYENLGGLAAGAAKGGRLKATDGTYPLSNESMPERRFEEIDNRLGRMANLITTRSDVFEILVTVQAGNATDVNGDNRIDYRDVNEFSVMAESQGRVIYERRARTDRSDEASQ